MNVPISSISPLRLTGVKASTARPTAANRLLLMSAVVVGLLASLVMKPVKAEERSEEQTDDPTSQIVSFFTIGWSINNAQQRNVGWHIRRTGWRGFVRQYVEPQLEAGVQRIHLHNPFGTLPDESMQFDQLADAREADQAWLHEDFVEAWRPVTERDIEVIAYLGKIEDTETFDRLEAEGKTDEWLIRAVYSLHLPLRAGMSIGLDSASTTAADSPTHQLANLLRSLGTRVYVEPRPDAVMKHWHSYPIITLNRHWGRSDPDRFGHAGAAHKASNRMLTGEIIRIIRPTEEAQNWHNDVSWAVHEVHQILADGDTAAVPMHHLLRAGVTMEQLLDVGSLEEGDRSDE